MQQVPVSDSKGVRANSTQPIFIVEDDPDVSRLIRVNLQNAGFAAEPFSNSLSALAKARVLAPSLFLLDIMMPGEDGLDFCKRLRTMPEFAATPVIFVTAKTSEDDRVLGLECGANDYITKPFSPRELVARVKAALRKRQPAVETLKIGELEIDPAAMNVRVSGEVIAMTAVEYRIVEAMARSPRRVFTREQLQEIAVGKDTSAKPRAIDVYISRIRDKIEPIPRSPAYILTVRGAGYRFAGPRESPQAPKKRW